MTEDVWRSFIRHIVLLLAFAIFPPLQKQANAVAMLSLPSFDGLTIVLLGLWTSVPCFVFYKLFLEGVIPRGIPWAGTGRTGRLAQLESTILAIFSLRRLLLQGYREDRPFLLGVFHNGPMMVLPKGHIRWYHAQLAKGNISFDDLFRQKMHLEYAAIKTEMNVPAYVNLLRRVLSQNYAAGLPDICEAVRERLDFRLRDVGKSWLSVRCFDLIEDVVAVGVTRLLIGSDLSRNEDFLRAARMTTNVMFPTGIIVQSSPAWLRPVVGNVCRIWAKLHWGTILRTATPTIEYMLDQKEIAHMDPDLQPTLVSGYIKECRKIPEGDRLLTLPNMQDLIGHISLGTNISVTLVCMELLLNVLSHAGCESLVETLRIEGAQLLGNITKNTLSAMPVTDIVIRETLRLETGDDFMVQGVLKVPLKSKDGTFLPPGTVVALPLYALHRDPELYPGSPTKFNPYRFCENASGKQTPAHEVSEQYLAFAMGPHACPGRWLAVATIKIVIATMLLEYDLKPLKARPWTPRMGGYVIPPFWSKIQIRKREVKSE